MGLEEGELHTWEQRQCALREKDLINDIDSVQCLTKFEDLNIIAGSVHVVVCFFSSR